MASFTNSICSLEDDDGNELFITQSVSQDVIDGVDDDFDGMDMSDDELLGIDLDKLMQDATDSKDRDGAGASAHYSDISDPKDDFENPVYQKSRR